MSVSDGVITWDDVLLVAEEERASSETDPSGFANISDRQKDFFIALANNVISFERYEELTYFARCYYVAHRAILSVTQAAGQGTVSSESIGGVSVSNTMPVNNPSADQGILETHFGRQYYDLKQIVKSRLKNRIFVG